MVLPLGAHRCQFGRKSHCPWIPFKSHRVDELRPSGLIFFAAVLPLFLFTSFKSGLGKCVTFFCSSIKIYSVVLQSETQASPDWLSWADIWQSDNLSRYLTGAGDEVDNRRTGERERFLFWKTPGYWGGDLWDIFIFHWWNDQLFVIRSFCLWLKRNSAVGGPRDGRWRRVFTKHPWHPLRHWGFLWRMF